jgi:hypothetical protein
MTTRNEPDPDIIRITRQEVYGSHVDDLLTRQKSLRGERDVARGKRGPWFYQNWFVFMVAGGLAAFAAWALIEPRYDDLPYYQGTIQRVDPTAMVPSYFEVGERYFRIGSPGAGLIQVNGQDVWLLTSTRERESDGTWGPLDPGSLQPGQEVGVYVEYLKVPERDVALARFVVTDPPRQSAGRAGMTLRQLDARSDAAGLLLFGVVAGLIGLAIGAVDGVICRLPRRAFLAGAVGLMVGFIGGFVSGNLANLVYSPINTLVLKQMSEAGSLTAGAFSLQMLGRSLAWACAGMTMGLGQGVALRSGRLLLFGFLGGVIGALLGGLLFDPVDMLLLSSVKPSAHWSRLVGIVAIGLGVGAMIGVVELLARDAWLRMTEGPLAGKEFLIFKDLMKLGSSPRSEIYLFNDALVAGHHANLRMVGGEAEIEAVDAKHPVEVNRHPVDRMRLRHGDRITIGRTSFVFEKRGA